MARRNQWLILSGILFIAAALRWTGLDWDDYDHHHPDERYITWVATTIERPSSWSSAFDPAASSFNPYYWPPDAESEGIETLQGERRSFAYGHLPLYLGVAATRLAERLAVPIVPLLPQEWALTKDVLNGRSAIEFRHLTAVARALTGLIDLGTVLFLFLLGRRLFGATVGLLAAALLAVNVMHIQLAHFFAVDPYMTFFTVGAVYFLVNSKSGDGFKPVQLILGAIFIGFAVGSKFSAALLLLPLATAVFLHSPKHKLFWLAMGGFTAALAFILTNPFALLDQTCEAITPAVQTMGIDIPSLNWKSCYLANIGKQSGMVSGAGDFPFTRQYAGTTSYLYPIEMQLRWGMGWLAGAMAFAGFGWFLWRLWRSLDGESTIDWREPIKKNLRKSAKSVQSAVKKSSGLWITAAWVVPFFIVTGSFYVKFMRYMQPIAPFLLLFGAAMVLRAGEGKWRRARWTAVAATLVFTVFYAFAFVNMYVGQTHPWTAASQWIYRNAPPGALILSEQWDDSLPVSMAVDHRARYRAEYPNEQLTWLTGTGGRDGVEKLEANLQLLERGDYMVLTTNRIYGVVPRLPERYPLSSQYHQLLLDGALGYEVVGVYGRFPSLFGLHIKPDTFGWPQLTPSPPIEGYLEQFAGMNNGRADESFLVYDQPLTIIFENVGGMTAVEIGKLFSEERNEN